MKRYLKNGLAVLLLIVFVISSYLPVFAVGQPSKYSTQYNSGERDVICTTLDGTSADAYYNGSYEYDVLSTQSASQVMSSLRTLMRSTHSYTSSYNDCHYKADRTDCENGDGSVSLIYTNYSATMSQWNGWNREHVWPQSLGGNNTSGGGADLHHIRPSDAVVNSTRGNKKYGNVDGGSTVTGKNPATGYVGGTYNSTYFEPNDNVKGDVARICLYVYVRWGSDWGADNITKVFQSIDVLLEWCEMDPVDTWEMGRNEVVEDIQGNRNVFIDYPEYAWLIFGREVPSDMVTPSGEAMEGGAGSSSCDHANTSIRNEAQATCGTAGYTGDTYCNDCGKKVSSGTTIAATGNHSTAVRGKVDATCGVAGYSGDTYCVICSTVVVRGTTISATGLHSFTAWVIDYDAGNKTRTCSVCNKTETTSISAEECSHPNSEVRNQKDATCGENGYSGDTCCTACNEILSVGRTIHSTGEHNYSEVIVVISPTLTAEGEGYKVCLDCLQEFVVTIPCDASGIDSMTAEDLFAYAGSDAEKLLLLLALGVSDSAILDSLSK